MARIRWKGNKKNFQHCQNSASIGCCQVNNKRDKLVFLKKKKKKEKKGWNKEGYVKQCGKDKILRVTLFHLKTLGRTKVIGRASS